ncbi:efflux RND transporter periplasmic adaptor subunit [Mitsuaria sp. WAJ17]|uniref:efflux RND transporter periplasmic adaptor subunit n=1 Tax=Mitsuaria sp. WAJ17 TaxID=2761452 RepID=UPI001604226B|nr:efflux RND transporter periplasmic adaptor subunit [Mitsuaria sp. WAJ17]MBB2488097.1 efflux RND transporter periplasmic adaptor subunit [Mitsuaria sp. WAJ17]
MRRTPVVATILLLILAAVAWRWKPTPTEPGAQAPAGAASAPAAKGAAAPQAVGVVTVQRQDVPVSIEAAGTVAALQSVDLRAQTTSTVREVLVKDGQMVTKGQVLFRFDDRADRANLDKARAQLARDRASLADAERQLQRAQDLLRQGFVAQSAVDTALSTVEAQRALVQADEAAVQGTQVSVSYNELRAPLSGRAGLVNAMPGSLVQANASATPLLNIAQLSPIGVSFVVPETQLQPLLAAVRPGADGRTEPLDVQVSLPGAPRSKGKAAEPALKGQLRFVDNLVDAATGTIKARAEFDNAAQQLWPGQYVRVRLTLRTLKNAVVVPQAALILRGAERTLYVVGPDKTAQLKTVQLRYGFGDFAVVEGLEAGEQVVLEGKQNLRPGTPLKVQPAAVDPGRVQRADPAASAAPAAASGASA